MRSFRDVCGICKYAVAASELIVEVELSGVGKELVLLAPSLRSDRFAVKILVGDRHSVNHDFMAFVVEAWEETLAEKTFTPEAVVAHAAAETNLETAQVELAGSPELSLTDLRIVIVTELVSLLEHLGMAVCHPVVEVILDHVREG